MHARLADVRDRHGRPLESVNILVLDHALNASYVDVPQALMPELKRGHRSYIRQWGNVQVVEPALPRAVRSDLVAILKIALPPLNDISEPHSSFMPTDMRLKPIVGAWSTFFNLTLRVLP